MWAGVWGLGVQGYRVGGPSEGSCYFRQCPLLLLLPHGSRRGREGMKRSRRVLGGWAIGWVRGGGGKGAKCWVSVCLSA